MTTSTTSSQSLILPLNHTYDSIYNFIYSLVFGYQVYLAGSISDMAQELGYSDSYFYRLFYKQMKQAPMSYYMNLKIKRACELLSETYLQINQVAMKIGFEDSYYFSRFFKKQTGMSPKQYREQHKGLCA